MARHALYHEARERNPRRWSGSTRNWTPASAVTLNPERDMLIQAAGGANLTKSGGQPRFKGRRGSMASESEVIETTVGMVAAELAQRGLDAHDRVTVTIEADELIRAGAPHASSRPGLAMMAVSWLGLHCPSWSAQHL
jgi:hypothetical protein